MAGSPEERFTRNLVERALDAFVLTLEVYNRLSLHNRVEAFAQGSERTLSPGRVAQLEKPSSSRREIGGAR